MKAITITTLNQKTIATQFSVLDADIEEVLPPEHILVTPFGVDEHFEVLSPSNFDRRFIKTGASLKNDFYEIMPRV